MNKEDYKKILSHRIKSAENSWNRWVSCARLCRIMREKLDCRRKVSRVRKRLDWKLRIR